MYTLRFHGVGTALPRRSGKTETKYLSFVRFTFKNILYSQLWHQSVKMTMLKTSGCLQPWPGPKHSLRPAPSVSLQSYAGRISNLYLLRCACIYTRDIVKKILICASDLNSVLFAFVMFKAYIFYFIYFYQKNAIGRGKRSTRAQ